MELAEKTVIVTGAASGIGRAVVAACAREGAHVVAADINEAGLRDSAEAAKKHNERARVATVIADAAKPEDHEKVVQTAVQEFGALHAACNNAGIGGELNPVGDLSLDGWRKVIDVNLSGVFYAMHAQIPQMLQNGGGAIVNMASILGWVGTPGAAGYVAAKHGVLGLTQTAALEYSAQGIRINAVGPGYIDTPLLDSLGEEERAALVQLHPIGRLGHAEEVAELTVFLLSDRASFISGSYYPIDGAYLAQ